MDKLRECYDEMVAKTGLDAEPFASVKLVEAFRRYWRPDNVQVILLAESHVFTNDDDRARRLREETGLPGYPSNYARFVYCLGYGEDSLIAGRPPANNPGTWQYWELLFSCANEISCNESSAAVKKATTSNRTRIGNKIRLLETLRERGIWLVDASIMALYNRGKKPATDTMEQAIKISWRRYIGDIVAAAQPERIIVIGKGVVYKTLQAELRPYQTHAIYQPNARLTSEERLENLQTCHRLCLPDNE